ncbi:MAG: hypothetical protein VX730_01405 [Pseudomonadota bacterium]|nr:hypothetical protein [Pseudomonadota bacterium]
MNGLYAALDRFFLPLIQKGHDLFQDQKDSQNTVPIWVAWLISIPMIFLDVSAMNVLTIILAGIFGMFAFTGKGSHDPLTPVDKWRLFAPMAILAVPSILCLGEVDGFLLSTLGWASVALATLFAMVASYRVVVLQGKPLSTLMKVVSVLAVPTYLFLKPFLMMVEKKHDWLVANWRPVMVYAALAMGLATVWYPLPADDFVSIAGGVLGLIFGIFEFRSRSGEPAAADQWAIYGASALAISLGVLCPGNMFAHIGLTAYAAAVSGVAIVLAGYIVSKTKAQTTTADHGFTEVKEEE